jgi:hypothetical protein
VCFLSNVEFGGGGGNMKVKRGLLGMWNGDGERKGGKERITGENRIQGVSYAHIKSL